jgi:hypothetical protein
MQRGGWAFARQRSPRRAIVNFTALLASVVCLALAGCVVRGPEIKVKPPIEIRAEPSGGKFCPPGQAKKGNC